MAGNRFNAFQDHGVGIGLRISHYAHIFSRKPAVDWFEIISENYMIDGGRPYWPRLDRILEQYRVVQHGVSMYFGSVTAPDPEHLKRLKQLVRRTKTPWLSDHLCWFGRWHLYARPAATALYMGSRRAHRRACAHGARLS